MSVMQCKANFPKSGHGLWSKETLVWDVAFVSELGQRMCDLTQAFIRPLLTSKMVIKIMPTSWAIVGVMWYYLKTNKHLLSGRHDYLIRAHTVAEGQANKSRDKVLGWYHQTLGFLCPLKPNKKIRDRVWESSVSGEETQLPRASRTVRLPSGVWEVCLLALGWRIRRKAMKAWRSSSCVVSQLSELASGSLVIRSLRLWLTAPWPSFWNAQRKKTTRGGLLWRWDQTGCDQRRVKRWGAQNVTHVTLDLGDRNANVVIDYRSVTVKVKTSSAGVCSLFSLSALFSGKKRKKNSFPFFSFFTATGVRISDFIQKAGRLRRWWPSVLMNHLAHVWVKHLL